MDRIDENVQITYTSTELQPPLFLAGSFSSPPWTPFEMDHRQADSGEHIFSKTIRAKPGSTVQYKFRVGLGDWWVLDEGLPTTTDDMGNRNNVLKIKAKESYVMERPPTPPPDSPIASQSSPTQSERRTSRLDKFDVTDIAAQNEDTHGLDFAHELAGEADSGPDSTPVFAYEYAGGDHDRTLSFSGSEHSAAHAVRGDSSKEEFDLKDPTLERFPCNREDILEKVRNIETGLTEDVPVFEGCSASPVIRKSSAELNSDSFTLSPTSPTSPTASFSGGDSAVPRNRSVSKSSAGDPSLQCIMEEGHPDGEEEDDDSAILSMSSKNKKASPGIDVSPKTVTPLPSTETPPTVVHEDGNANAENNAAAAFKANAETQQVPQTDALPALPQSVTAQSSNWFYAFVRLLFVDWIGAFFGRAFGRRSA